LLHHTLNGMKEKGFEYAIIGDDGPIEFYEKLIMRLLYRSIYGNTQ
jgi:hypothetical protein